MNDHNLDDLIIDNIDPKNSKTKSFLTVIALAIVVLIVAIILTKIILKDPNEKALLEEDNTELISPELTLQSVTKETVKAPSIKEELTIKPKKEAVVKPKTIEIVKETKSPVNNIVKVDEAKLASDKKALEESIAQAKKEHELKMAAQIKKQKELEIKHLAETKAQQEADAKKVLESKTREAKKVLATSGYFIQVGSFTQSPSARFLSVIKNSGFNHQITAPSSNGTKKLLIGPYGTRAEVDAALVRVRDRINKSAFVVKK
jgi:DedD protein